MQSRHLLSLSLVMGGLIAAAGCSSAAPIEEPTGHTEDALTLRPNPTPASANSMIIFVPIGITAQQRAGVGRIFHTGAEVGLAEADMNYGDVVRENVALRDAQVTVPDTRWAITAPGYSWPPIAPTSPSYGTVVGWRSSLHTSIATYSRYVDYYDFAVWLGFAEADCTHGATQNCTRALDTAVTIADRLKSRAPIGTEVLRDMRDLAFLSTDQASTQIAALRDRYERVVYASAEFTPNQCVLPGLKSSCADRVDGYAFMVAPGTRCPTLDVQSLNATWYPDTGLPIENGKGPFGAIVGESSMVTPSMYRDSPLCAYAYAGLRDNATFTVVNPATRTPDLMCQAMAAHPEMKFSAAAYLLTENPADECRQEDLGGGVWQVRCPQLKGGCDTCLR